MEPRTSPLQGYYKREAGKLDTYRDNKGTVTPSQSVAKVELRLLVAAAVEAAAVAALRSTGQTGFSACNRYADASTFHWEPCPGTAPAVCPRSPVYFEMSTTGSSARLRAHS